MKKRNLTFKFSLMFAAFTLVTLVITSILSYINQMNLYKKHNEKSIQYVANYLERRIVADGMDFLDFQKYFMTHSKELSIDPNFSQKNVDEDREIYEKLFAQAYPGATLDFEIDFDGLPEDVKMAYTKYSFEYYQLMFEEAVKSFGIAYTYYIVPSEKTEHMNWVILSLRETVQKDGKDCLLVNDFVSNPRSVYRVMWEAWDTGKRPSGYHVYDNKYGNTYAYYTPLFINGQKLGLIGVEVEVSAVNREILNATIRQMLVSGSVLVLFMLFLLFVIRYCYIKKLVNLKDIIEEYSNEKNPKIAERLKAEVTNEDEISQIMSKFSDMIYQLELYIHNFAKTKQDLQNTRLQAIELNEFAIKDTLTEIRNKAGYDKEVQNIEWEMAEGLTQIGAAMIDIDFLKKINDTYGHEKGNLAIISICRIVCHIFEHSPVFRTGGDEFAVILKNHDLIHIDELVSEFKRKLSELKKDHALNPWEKISASIGYAVYDPKLDMSFESIMLRATDEMCRTREAAKSVRKD